MNKIDHQYLRPIKAQRRLGMLESEFPLRRDLQVWQGRSATILPMRDTGEEGLLFGRGGVVDANGNYVPLSGLPGRVDRDYPFENPQYRDEKVVCCGYLVNQWGHFLVEGVTRLWYFLENDPTIDKYVFFIDEDEDREIRGNYREFLELFGIWDKLEFISRPTIYREVVVPEIGYLCQKFFSQKYRDIFDHVAENVRPDASWTPAEKIFFSRNQFKKHGSALEEFGYDVLDDFFQKNGYLVLYPEKFSLSQMIFYIRNCDTMASCSGSVEHNVLFAREGQKIEVMERWIFNDDNQVDIDRIRELNAVYVDVTLPLYTTDFGGPFLVGYNAQLQRFGEDRGYLPPDARFLTEKYRKECFANYMRAYWDQYRYHWFMQDWYTTCTDYLWEGYKDGRAYFGDYLDGKKPFFWYHYFQPHYVKGCIKFLLRKLGLYHG